MQALQSLKKGFKKVSEAWNVSKLTLNFLLQVDQGRKKKTEPTSEMSLNNVLKPDSS